MTTYITGNALVYPDGTSQTTASITPPQASTQALGTVIHANTAEVQNKWEDGKYLTSQHLGWAEILGAGASGQTWQVLTGARAPNVTYTNTTGRGIVITVTSNVSGDQVFSELIVNGVLIQTVGGDQDNGGASVVAIAVVPPGGTYRSTHGHSHWAELR